MTRHSLARAATVGVIVVGLIGVTTAIVRAAPTDGCTIAAAGDIAEQGGDQALTAEIVRSLNPTAVVTLGDNAYPSGSTDDFRNYYDPSWGQFKAITRPAVGNHEYQTTGARGYLNYFGVPPYYASTICSWRMYSLNREITGADREAELTWLRGDLATHRDQPKLAIWHEPRWTSGTKRGSDEGAADLWTAVADSGVKLVLNGHEHSYERLTEMNAAGDPTPGGTREFIIGEGGSNDLSGFGGQLASSEKRIAGAHGVLSMTLRPDGYDWRLLQVGGTIGDQGSQQFTSTTGDAHTNPAPADTGGTAQPTLTEASPTTSSGTPGGDPTPGQGQTPPDITTWSQGSQSTTTATSSTPSQGTQPSEGMATPGAGAPNGSAESPATTAIPPIGAARGAGQMLATFFGPALGLTEHGAFGWQQTQLLPGAGPTATPALRVTYPVGTASRRAEAEGTSGDGGAQAYLPFRGGPLDDAWLGYDVQFPPGFQFVKGGKLPGLYGGTVTSGQHIPDGTNGFSTRYMWRTGGAGEVYAYLPTSITHGTSLGRGNWTWPTGRWTHTVQHVHLNTHGTDNGTIDVWVDGHPVLHQENLRFRTTTQLRIDGLFFSTFFGGGDASWATPTTQHVDFAGFTTSATPLPTDEKAGTLTPSPSS